MTTRAPRRGERQGHAYRFISHRAFERLRRTGQLLEWASVHGARYGTPRAPVERSIARGRDVVLSIDVQGARQIRRQLGRRAVLIFLLPTSMAMLKRRLAARRTENAAAIRNRLQVAQRELRCVHWYDYVIVNDRLERAVQQLHAIVTAHGCRVR